MTGEVDCLNRVEKLDRLKSIVESTTSHNGYPVVENDIVKQSYDDGAIRIRSEYDRVGARLLSKNSLLKMIDWLF